MVMNRMILVSKVTGVVESVLHSLGMETRTLFTEGVNIFIAQLTIKDELLMVDSREEISYSPDSLALQASLICVCVCERESS